MKFLQTKFSAFNVDFSSSSPDPPRFKETGAGGRQRQLPPVKSGYFIAIISCSVKTVADRYIHAAYHNKHWWHPFWIYQYRWPWTTLNLSKRGF